MIKHNQDGAVNPLLLPFVLATVLFIGALGFGFWAFAGRQDYKDNSDQKAAVAAAAAKASEAASKDKQYAELAKSPYKVYKGPEQYGTIQLTYPKTWSGYVSVAAAGTSNPLNGYFNPDVVPSTSDQASTFALRLEVVTSSYSDTLRAFNNVPGVTVSPYALPKLPNVVGAKVTGQIENQKQGTMVILPVRDKTLKVYTEANAFQNDFNNIILANLSFAP